MGEWSTDVSLGQFLVDPLSVNIPAPSWACPGRFDTPRSCAFDGPSCAIVGRSETRCDVRRRHHSPTRYLVEDMVALPKHAGYLGANSVRLRPRANTHFGPLTHLGGSALLLPYCFQRQRGPTVLYLVGQQAGKLGSPLRSLFRVCSVCQWFPQYTS